MIHHSLLWACEPTALAGYRSTALRMGPVDDAERAGLAIRRHGAVAVIPVRGMLLPRAPWWAIAEGYATSTHEVRAAVLAAQADDAVERVILLMDSPGGSVMGVDETAVAIAALAAAKPVTVQVAGQMASAAYYLGSQGTEIVAGRTDMIGSIGTRITLWDMSRAFEEMGVTVHTVDTGPFKSAGEPGTPITEEHLGYFQSVVDGFQRYFRAAVQRGRSLDDKQFAAVADGRMWLAEEAQALGLIDRIATADETLAAIAHEGGQRSRRARASARLRLQQQRRRARN